MKFQLNDTIIFDAYGTLLNLNSIDTVLIENFGEEGVLIGNLWRQKQLEYSWLRSLMNRYIPFHEITVDALLYATTFYKVKLNTELRKKILNYYEKLDFYEDAFSVLKRLKSNYTLVVLSNANLVMLKAAIKNNNCLNAFDYILSADSIKEYKPRPSVYQLSVNTLGIAKEKITFVSSNPWDVTGAKSYGFNAIWVNRKGIAFDHIGQVPDVTITSLGELNHML